MLANELDDWIDKTNGWMNDAIDGVKSMNAADAEWLTTPGEVPLTPRIAVPAIQLGGQEDRDRYGKAFREHDFQLSRFEKLCTKYGIGV